MDLVGTFIPWIVTFGLVAVVTATFVERLIPMLPSYVLLVVIGIASAEGYFSLPAAIALSTVGSVLGCMAVYAIGTVTGESRFRNFLERLARLVGIQPVRFNLWLERLRANEYSAVASAQIVPGIRVVAPGISGLLRANFGGFVAATTIGVALWDTIFIGVGYVAKFAADDTNASVLALETVIVLLVAEALFFSFWSARAKRKASGRSVNDRERHGAKDLLLFLRAWAAHPLRIAAVSPSSSSLADLITSEITSASSPVIELGPGTGVFTRALVARGVPEDRLVLVEAEVGFSQLLARRFPSAHVLSIDAAHFGRAKIPGSAPAGAAISGLPLLSMSPRKVIAILDGTFDRLRPHGALYQFTYGLRCPIPRWILDRLGLKAVRIGGTMANVPPASVYRITRRRARRESGADRVRAVVDFENECKLSKPPVETTPLSGTRVRMKLHS